MFTLTLQFLVALLLPLCLLIMLVYTLLVGRRRQLPHVRWSLTLLAALIWASMALRYYGGTRFDPWLVFRWSGIGHVAVGLTMLGVLLTSLRLFDVPGRKAFWVTLPSLLLLLAALALDPAIWLYTLPDFRFAGQIIQHFQLWAGLWIAAWLLPLITAALITQQARANLDHSLYRNFTSYWLLTQLLFGIGAALASIQQPEQPIWQEAGIIVAAVAAFVGTQTLTRRLWPDLWLTLRQMAIFLLGFLLIFTLLWFSLWLASTRRAALFSFFVLTIGALALAVLVTAVTYGGLMLNRRAAGIVPPWQEPLAVEYAPDLQQFGHRFLETVSARLAVSQSWLFTIETGVGGMLLLRPLASRGHPLPDAAELAVDSPFTEYLRQHKTPILQIDIATMNAFANVSADEQALLARWGRVLYMPLHSAETLVGLLALGPRYAGQAFRRQDVAALQWLASEFGPLLAQMQDMTTLERLNTAVWSENQALAREKRFFKTIADLQKRVLGLLSPELKRPFPNIYERLETLPADQDQAMIQSIDTLKAEIEALIRINARVQKHTIFHFEPVYITEIGRAALRRYENLATARRVRLNWLASSAIPLVWGDARQLEAAVGYILHNGIKFNRIDGEVTLEAGIVAGKVFLRILDTGVGMNAATLEALRMSFTAAAPLTYNHYNGRFRIPFGLILAHSIISAHDGQLEIHSEYGRGSELTLYLPIQPEHASEN